MVAETLKAWYDAADRPGDVESVVVFDGNDTNATPDIANHIVGTCKGTVIVTTQPDPPFNCVRGWNYAAARASGKAFIVISDDFRPPEHWDSLLEGLQPQGWMEGDWSLHVNDGIFGQLCTLPIFTRKRYDRYGYAYFPGYLSLFCDTELTYQAKQDGRLLDATKIVFQHIHHCDAKRAADAVDAEHSSEERWKVGEELYKRRLENRFPTEFLEPWRCAAAIQVIRDDFCLEEVTTRLVSEGILDIFYFVPSEYWKGTVTPQADIDTLKAKAESLSCATGARIRHVVVDVAQDRVAGEDQLVLEAKCRNRQLEVVEQAGFRHTIVVDSDELLKVGAVDKIREVVVKRGAVAIDVGMTPVVGVPGVPVADAKDTALVYVRHGVRFSVCRAVTAPRASLPQSLMFHFTATRATTDDLSRKMLESGHYSDPDYDFDGWLKNVAPYISTSSRNLHMYRKRQIWPRARQWEPSELAQIPGRLHQYLAI